MEIPKGYLGSCAEAAIKRPGRPDLALIFSEVPATCAGVFTTNKVKAAPVVIDMERVMKGFARAILANSGNANACTGDPGIQDALLISSSLSRLLNIPEEQVLLASTGVIGQRLPVPKVLGVIPDLIKGLSPTGLLEIPEAIMTTDKFPKTGHRSGSYKGQDYHIYAMAKGAGMIMPNMATMLCFVLTDFNMGQDDLNRALRHAVDKSFNQVTVDGDTSTNDTVLLLANGLAGNVEVEAQGYMEFEGMLTELLRDLARMIAKDGEGATKLVRVLVRNAADPVGAGLAARTIANSMLVKTALFGMDPNWGRILAAVGRSGADFAPERVDIFIDEVQIVQNGVGLGTDAEEEAREKMKKDEFDLVVDLNQGAYETELWTCDLTYDYVKINAEYRT